MRERMSEEKEGKGGARAVYKYLRNKTSMGKREQLSGSHTGAREMREKRVAVSSGGRPGTPGPLASRSELRHVDDEHTHNTHEALLERLLVRAEALCVVVGRGLELAPRIVPVAHLIDLLLGDVDVVLDEQRVLLLDGEEVVKPMAMILVTAVEMVVQMAGAPTFFGPSFRKSRFAVKLPAQVLSKPRDPCGARSLRVPPRSWLITYR